MGHGAAWAAVAALAIGCVPAWSARWKITKSPRSPETLAERAPIAASGMALKEPWEGPPPVDGAILYAAQGTHEERDGRVVGSIVGPDFGGQSRWTIMRPEEGDDFLSISSRDGALRLTLHAGCGGDQCEPGDVRWLRGERHHWLPERMSAAYGEAILAYDVELGRAGVGARISPFLRRVSAGGLAIGVSLSYADFGVRQRFAITIAFFYDLSYLVRRELGGVHRPIEFGIGADAGLGVAALASDFGQALLLGAALDPYAELRVHPTADVAIPVRVGASFELATQSSYFLELSGGAEVAW